MNNLRNLEIRSLPQKFDLKKRLKPETVFRHHFLFRCNVKILVVTDSGSGGFGTVAGFHLGRVLDAVDDDPWSHIKFQFTKAHRGNSAEAGVLDNFEFDSHNLSQYSQIWLFGIKRESQGGALTDSELKALSDFMDETGGGVFATGDHEDLGNPLAAQVLRVRSMRRWYYPNPGPNGEPVAPAQSGVDRHDTLVNGGSQTDPEPQSIRPRYYHRFTGAFGAFRRVKFPHPVLCGPNGVINYLPDHMHEGLCEVPSDLSQSYTFDGKTYDEYPTKNGVQERPEVIAWATNNVTNTEFGVLGAYDGHEVGVGRVVVDATWHHWFNINILPYINATDPLHPTYTPATEDKFEEIKDYFRNVAVWLAKPSMQSCIRNGGWIRVLGDFDIAITYRPLKLVKHRYLYFWQLGVFAKDALGRSASQCQSLSWIWWIAYAKKLTFRASPFKNKFEKEKMEETPEGLDLDELETIALGAAIHGAFEEFGEIDKPEQLLEDDGKKFETVLRKSAQLGIEAYKEKSETSFKDMSRMLKKM